MTPAGRGGADTWAGAGLIAGPACWFVQQQLAWYLLPFACAGRGWIAPLVSAVFALVLLGAAFLSWRALRRVSAAGNQASFTQRRAHFVGLLGSIMPLLFLVAIAWQFAASLVYSGCER